MTTITIQYINSTMQISSTSSSVNESGSYVNPSTTTSIAGYTSADISQCQDSMSNLGNVVVTSNLTKVSATVNIYTNSSDCLQISSSYNCNATINSFDSTNENNVVNLTVNNVTYTVTYTKNTNTWAFSSGGEIVYNNIKNGTYTSSLSNDELVAFGVIICADDSPYPEKDNVPWTTNSTYGMLFIALGFIQSASS